MGVTDRLLGEDTTEPSLGLRSSGPRATDALYNAVSAGPAPVDDSSSFTKGLRSGFTSAGGQLHALAGQAAEGVGATGYAADQRAQSLAAQQQAAQESEGMIHSYKDVHGLRDAWDYGTGLIGQSIPAVGAAILGSKLAPGRSAAGALVGGTAASLPLTLGSQFESQQNDPEQAQRGYLERTATGGLAGLTNAVAGSIVPSFVGGKYLGRAAEGAVTMPAGKALATNALEGVAGQGAAGYTSAAVDQAAANALNPNRDTSGDEAARMEAAVGGAVTGLPLAAMGARADMRGAREGGIPLGEPAPAGEPVAPKETLFDRAKNVFKAKTDRGPVSMDDLGSIIQPEATTGDHFAVDAGLAQMRPDQHEAAFAQADQQAGEQAAGHIDALRARTDLTPEDAATLDAMNPADQGAQIRAKDMVTEYRLKDRMAARAENLNKALDSADEAAGVKSSKERTPDATDESALVDRFVRHAEDGTTTPGMREDMSAILGDKTLDTLTRAYGEQADPAKRDTFYKTVSEMDTERRAEQKLNDTVRASLPEGMAGRVPDDQISELVTRLRDLTSEKGLERMTANEQVVYKAKLNDKLQELFGDKFEKVNEEFAKDALRRQGDLASEPSTRKQTDETDAEIAARESKGDATAAENGFLPPTDTVTRYHDTKGEISHGLNGEGVATVGREPHFMLEKNVHSKEFGTSIDDTAHMRAERKATDEFKTHEPGWIRAEDYAKETGMSKDRLMELTHGEPEKYGLVTTKGEDNTSTLSHADIDRMRFDTERTTKKDGSRNMTRLDTVLPDGKPGPILDGFKIVKEMQPKTEYDSAGAGGIERTVRVFEEGIAALQDKLGIKFGQDQLKAVEIKSSGKGQPNVTYGDALNMRDEGLSNGDRTNVKMMRKQLAGLENTPENRAERLQLKNDIAAVHNDAGLTGEAKDAMAGLRASDANLRGKMEAAAADGDLTKYGELSAARKGITDRISKLLSDQTPDPEMKAQAAGMVEPEADPRGQVHEAVKEHGADAQIKVDEAGQPISQSETRKPVEPIDREATLDARIRSLEANAPSTSAQALAARLRTIFNKVNTLDGDAQVKFTRMVEQAKRPSDIDKATLDAMEFKLKRAEDAKVAGRKELDVPADLAEYLGLDKSGKEKALTNIERTREQIKGVQENADWRAFEELLKVAESKDAKALQGNLMPLLRVKNPNENIKQVIEAYNKRISDLLAKDDTGQTALKLQGAKSISTDGVVDESGKKSSAEKPTAKAMTPDEMKQVGDLVRKMLGDSVEVQGGKRMGVAGEYHPSTDDAVGLIRIAVNALNPQGTAYHESLHAFFDQMGKNPSSKRALEVLTKAGNDARVRDVLRKEYKDQPEVLSQLETDAEERAAYMFQLYAQRHKGMTDALKAPARSVLERVVDMVRSAMGIWTNHQRAEHIMNYFESGEYAKNLDNKAAVGDSLMLPGSNKYVSKLARDMEPLRKLAAAALTIGSERVRDMNIGAFDTVLDKINPGARGEGSDPGMVTARRVQSSRMKNELQDGLAKLNAVPEDVNEALRGLRLDNTSSLTPTQKGVADLLTNTFEKAFQYMQKSGVDVGRLDLQKKYAPRVWDSAYIAAHETEFRAMMDKYVQSGAMEKGSVDRMLNKLMANDGGEIVADGVVRPGNEFTKERVLKFVTPEDAEAFIVKDALRTVTHYLDQAAKRGEWASRFGTTTKDGIDESGKLRMHIEQAKRQGASEDDIKTLERYIAGVNGTLGEGMSPGARKLASNMMVYQNMRLLPLGIFSAMIDANGIMVKGGTVGEAAGAFMRGVKEIRKNFEKSPDRDAAYKFAEDIGAIDNVALNHALGGGSFGMTHASPVMRALNDKLFRYNGMEQWNMSMRVSAAQAALGFLGRHAEGSASPHSARWLAELGLRPGDVQKGPDGRPMVTQQEFIDSGMSPEKALEASNKMTFAVNRWVDGAILRPNATTKPIWMNDPHYALFGHMKQFMFAFQETTLKTVLHEARYGNNAPLLALASYIPVMLAADMARGLITGGGQEPEWQKNWGPGDYMNRAVQRAGLFGVGQIGIDTAKNLHQGGYGIGALGGPTVNQLTDVAQVAGGRRSFGGMVVDAIPAVNYLDDALENSPTTSSHGAR